MKYKLLNGSSCVKLPKELDHLKKGLINIQNIDDNECIKWCLVRYLRPWDHNFERIKKVENDFVGELDFKELRFSVKTRSIHKIDKKIISISVFDYGNKKKYPINLLKKYFQKAFWFIETWRIPSRILLPDEIGINKEMSINYQWKITYFDNIAIGNVNFLIKKSMYFIRKTDLRLGLKLKNTFCIRI